MSRAVLLSSLLMVACGDASPPASDNDAGVSDSGTTPSACQDETKVLPFPSSFGGTVGIIDVVLDKTPSTLVTFKTSADVRAWGFIDIAGTYTEVAQRGPALVSARAFVRGDGARCATYRLDGDLWLSCDDGTDENAGIKIGRTPIPYPRADGSISFLTTTTASYTVIERSASGTWREIEQYESSISYPQAITATKAGAATCFVSHADIAVVSVGGTLFRTSEKVSKCWIAADDTGVHVLTDKGYGLIEASRAYAISQPPVATIDLTPVTLPQDVLGLVATHSGPQLFYSEGAQVMALRLPNGQTASVMATDALESQHVAYEDDRLLIAGRQNGMLSVQTRCLPESESRVPILQGGTDRCNELASCCASVEPALQPICQAAITSASQSVCATALQQFCCP